ncbi:hypothetical protein BJP06_06270 [Corynebacterium sp. NML120713]|nr:DnaB-like helicase C-terminal domain-containing protein [Corynebacterium sp. NML120713]OIR43182.1 hypothetical protein BJP06_06270 [Corynebacterium sp. NML120713]
MLSLVQSAAVRGSAGEALPTVWQSLTDAGTVFRRGQLCLVAAGPGVGKSAFVLSYALQSRVSTLYFSADSDAYVQLSRSLAILGGLTMSEAGELALNPDYKRIQAITEGTHVRFDYNSSPTLGSITEQVHAYNEMYGDYPELIVVDNALDVEAGDAEDQAQSLDELMGWLHDLARTTEACVVVLHHVTGPYNDSASPIPLSGVKGQIGRVPELILTLHKSVAEHGGGDELRVSTVKNRGFRADPSGATFVPLAFDGFRMSIKDVQEKVWDDDPFAL